jgi:hypothetical protein
LLLSNCRKNGDCAGDIVNCFSLEQLGKVSVKADGGNVRFYMWIDRVKHLSHNLIWKVKLRYRVVEPYGRRWESLQTFRIA